VIRRQSPPISDDEPHRVLPPTPAPGPEPKPALDALTLLALWRRFRMVGDVTNAARTLNELEWLAERPKRRTGGDRDDAVGGTT